MSDARARARSQPIEHTTHVAASRARGRVLHVAALPFPTYQGTQAAIAHMLETSVSAGFEAELLSYATAAYEHEPSFAVHRAGRASSLQSGPSLEKLRLDAGMGLQLAMLRLRLRPDVIVAHHVEAAALALATSPLTAAPLVFFAHTNLEVELPMYTRTTNALTRRGIGHAGRTLDRQLAQRIGTVAVISKTLVTYFESLAPDANVFYVPTPWKLQPAFAHAERLRARRELGVASHETLALYAGNLDAYQGMSTLLAAISCARARLPTLRLLIATESDNRELRAEAARLGLSDALLWSSLAGAATRRHVHAAADLAVVPRLAPGGLPIKLLDALSRGLPCASMPHACAGLSLQHSVEVARDESPAALAAAITTLVREPRRRAFLALAGRAQIAEQHNAERFVRALERAIGSARARHETRRRPRGRDAKRDAARLRATRK